MLDEYTKEHKKTSESLSSIEDMQRFVEKYPELKSKGLAVGKHVALMSEMGLVVDDRRFMELSEIEQNIACTDNPNDHLRDVMGFLTGGKVDPFDALRLFALYALRYECVFTRSGGRARGRQTLPLTSRPVAHPLFAPQAVARG
jgi:vacuolar protein sorting-associated protein 45